MADMSGKCLCGKVTFTAVNVKTGYHVCHCEMCRKWNGGPTMAVPVGKIVFPNEEYLGLYESSDWAERGFCKNCGTNLLYRIKAGDHTSVWVGAFDDQTAFKLFDEIYIDSKPDSYAFAGEHPRLTEEQTLKAFGVKS